MAKPCPHPILLHAGLSVRHKLSLVSLDTFPFLSF